MKFFLGPMPEKVRDAVATGGALVLILGSFLTMSGDLDLSAPFGLAAVFASLSNGPSVVITRNVNSPTGVIMPGRSQVLAVYDVKANHISQVSTLQRTVASVSVNGGNALNVTSFVLDYRYCIPMGNVYGYGYRYGYAGTYCRNAVASPVSVVRVGDSYTVTFVPNFVIYPGQTSSILTLSGYAYYTSLVGTAHRTAQVQAKLLRSNTFVQTTQCGYVHYGYGYQYGYSTCHLVGLTAAVSSAVGNWLSVLQTYSYGYTPIVWTSNTTTSQDTPSTLQRLLPPSGNQSATGTTTRVRKTPTLRTLPPELRLAPQQSIQ